MYELLNHTVDVYSKGVSTTTDGNAEAFTLTYANVAANVQAGAGSLELHDDGRKVRVDYRVFVSQNVNVNPGDRIVYNGLNLKVITVQNLVEAFYVWVIYCQIFYDDA